MIYRWLFLLCGIKMSLWRLCSLLGGCSAADCLLRIIFNVVVLLITHLRCVCQGVDQSNHQIIYFYIVIFLDQFGTLFIGALVYQRLFRFMCHFIFLDHFNQFTFSGGISKVRRSIIQVIWFATVWEIWKERNNIQFNDKVSSVTQVVENIKSLAFTWLKAKFVSLPFNYHGWWLSLFAILGIG